MSELADVLEQTIDQAIEKAVMNNVEDIASAVADHREFSRAIDRAVEEAIENADIECECERAVERALDNQPSFAEQDDFDNLESRVGDIEERLETLERNDERRAEVFADAQTIAVENLTKRTEALEEQIALLRGENEALRNVAKSILAAIVKLSSAG